MVRRGELEVMGGDGEVMGRGGVGDGEMAK